jgi:hypothetical protein
VNPTELWAEVEVTNLGGHPAAVHLTAYRWTGQEITQFDHTLEGFAKYTFKIEQPFMDLVSADEGLFDERLKAMMVGRSDSSFLTWKVRQLKLYEDQIETTDFGELQPHDSSHHIVSGDLPKADVDLVLSNITAEAKTALICRGFREIGCMTESSAIHIPAHGSRLTIPPSGLGDQLIINSGGGVVAATYRPVMGSTSTFSVNSGVTFGQPVGDK